MSRKQGFRLALLSAAIAAGAGLSGCGKQGVLQQPPPLFGSRAKAEYEAQKAQQAKDDAQRSAIVTSGDQGDQSAGDNAPRTRRDVKDPNQILTPTGQSPIAGAPNPLGAPVQATPNF